MGNYAISIHFSDGHTTGIYSWSYLYYLGSSMDELWKDYCNKVDEYYKNKNKNNFHQVLI